MTCNDEKVWMTNYSQNPDRHNPTTLTFNGKTFCEHFLAQNDDGWRVIGRSICP